MYINNTKNIILFRTKKTAGSTVSYILKKLIGLGIYREIYAHIEYNQLLDHCINNNINLINFYKVICVRNPYDMLVSMFWWRYRNINLKSKSKKEILNLFNLYIYECINLNELDINIGLLPGINTKNYLKHYDFIIRYEDLKIDIYELLIQLNIDISYQEFEYIINNSKKVELTKQNIRDHSIPYQEYYTKETKKLVENQYKDLIKYFNYKFE